MKDRKPITVTLAVRPVPDLQEWLRAARAICSDRKTNDSVEKALERLAAMAHDAQARRLMTVRPLPCERD